MGGLEAPLGDSLDRLSPPAFPRGDTYLIHLAPEADAETYRALFAAAAVQEVREVLVLDEAAAAFLPRDRTYRVLVASRLEHDPQHEEPPRLIRPEGEFETRLLELPSDPDGTWRRVWPAHELPGGSSQTLFADHTRDVARLALLQTSGVVALPAERVLQQTGSAPWSGGRWVIARPTRNEASVWTTRCERIRESRAVSLALVALEEDHVLRPAEPALVAAAAGALFVVCLVPWGRDPRLAGLLALGLAATTLAALVWLRAEQLVTAPILLLVVSAPSGFVVRLLESERSVHQRVAWLDDELRRERILTPLLTPPADHAALEALVRLVGAEAAAIVCGSEELVFATTLGDGAEQRALEAARLPLRATQDFFVQTSAGPALRIDAGAGVRIGFAGPAGELEAWWRARSERLLTCVKPLVPRAVPAGTEQELLFRLRASVQAMALERAFSVRALRQLPEAVGVYDALARPLLTNDRLTQLVARFPGANSLSELIASLTGLDPHLALARLGETLEEERPITSYVTLEPEGTHFVLVVDSVAIEGQGRFLVIIVRDVTELFALERSRGLLLRGLSDELRAAFQRVSLGTDLLGLQLGRDADALQPTLQQIRSAIDGATQSLELAERRGAETIDDDADGFGPLDLSLEVARCLEQVSPTATQLGANLERTGQRFTSVVWGRASALRDALCSALVDLLLSVGEGGHAELRIQEAAPGVRILLRDGAQNPIELTTRDETLRAASSAGIECRVVDSGREIRFLLPRAPSGESA